MTETSTLTKCSMCHTRKRFIEHCECCQKPNCFECGEQFDSIHFFEPRHIVWGRTCLTCCEITYRKIKDYVVHLSFGTECRRCEMSIYGLIYYFDMGGRSWTGVCRDCFSIYENQIELIHAIQKDDVLNSDSE